MELFKHQFSKGQGDESSFIPVETYEAKNNHANYKNPMESYNNSSPGYNKTTADFNNSVPVYNKTTPGLSSYAAPYEYKTTGKNYHKHSSVDRPNTSYKSPALGSHQPTNFSFKGFSSDDQTITPIYPTCFMCNGPIKNIIVQAMDRTWHPHHFRCQHCQIPIATQKFHVHNDKPYCVEDYAAFFLEKCQGCKLPIKDVVVTALDQTWHPDHFVCISCGSKLLYKGFYEKEDNAFCTECYENKFCPKCSSCGLPITETAIKVNDRTWHEACFKCGRCRRHISGLGLTFRARDAELMCDSCGQTEGEERRGEGECKYFESSE